MSIVKVTRNNQVTIPKKIARKLGINEGDYVEVILKDDEIVIRKVKKLDELVGSWKHVDVDRLLRSVEKRWKNWNSA